MGGPPLFPALARSLVRTFAFEKIFLNIAIAMYMKCCLYCNIAENFEQYKEYVCESLFKMK